MDVSIEELALLVEGRVLQSQKSVEDAPRISGAASVDEAEEGHVTFFGNAKYISALKASRATCALVPKGFSESILAIPIEVANPSLAFSKVIAHFAPQPLTFAAGFHSSAVVSERAVIGTNVSIQANAVIEAGAVIGDGTVIGANVYVGHEAVIGSFCFIYPNATIRERCVLGNRVIIHSGVVVGSDGFGFEFSQGRHVKIPQVGIVQIDDDVEIGANTTIDRARFGRTWIGAGTKVDNLVQIAHNVVIGKHCLVVSQAGISGSSKLGNYVTLAGQVGVVGHIQVGDQAVVAAQSGVSKDIPAKEVWWGSPATPMREQKEKVAYVSRLPKLWERVKHLEQALEALAKKISG